ncbi:MAG TPA: Ig-like domain-containing protein [Bacteroidota bacterium]|nr:Ig-like domain-containing protein [Bacteroidota bacterium]
MKRMNRTKRRERSDGRMRRMLPLLLLSLAVWCAGAGTAFGQDLENFGSITNAGSGLVRVKNQAINLPDSIGGTFEFKGADQPVPAKHYDILLLSGSGTKSTSPGDFTVDSKVTVNTGIELKIDSLSTMTVAGHLFENGYVWGKMKHSEGLVGTDTNSTFGNIGADISWNGTAPGITTIVRTSGASMVGNGNASIQRSYDIEPAANSGLNATLVFHYKQVELNGRIASQLVLWESTNGGSSWIPEGGLVDTAAKTITKTGIQAFGLWTASDSIHPLGRKPVFLTLGSGDHQTAAVRTNVSQFTVNVTSANGFGVPGVEVDFAIVATAPNSTGARISVSKMITDDLGQAATQLTLGSKVGQYSVAATANGLSGSPVTFNATAIAGKPAFLTLDAGDQQRKPTSDTLNNPFVITLADADTNVVSGVTITYSVTSFPPGAAGMRLIPPFPVTDANGVASALFVLGDRAGTYQVTAQTLNLTPVVFSAKALPRVAHSLSLNSGDQQQGIARTFLRTPLTVTAQDSFGVPVAGITVKFFVSTKPPLAIGDSLTVTTAETDSNGQAQTLFKLGSRAGFYQVSAFSQGLIGSPVTFSMRATIGNPAILAVQGGQGQMKPILKPLDSAFVVVVTDSNGNPVTGQPVQFAITGEPLNQHGDSLTATSVLTDSNGVASTILTVGSKGGTYTVSASSGRLMGSPSQFFANARLLYGDDDGNLAVNIGDLTTMIDAERRLVHLAIDDSIRADMDSNGVINKVDQGLLLKGMLNGTWDSIAFRSAIILPARTLHSASPSSVNGDPDIQARFEIAPSGLRFNLANRVPVRGVQVLLQLRTPAYIGQPLVSGRAKSMKVPLVDSLGFVRVVAYSNTNSEIVADTTDTTGSTIFRLPYTFTDTSQFTIVGVLVSTQNNKVYLIPASKGFPLPGEYPASFELSQNYPNPFNNSTKIQFAIPEISRSLVHVLVQVFDIRGQKIKTITAGDFESGKYVTTWDGTNEAGQQVATGVYLVRLWSPTQFLTIKMLFAK